jgi:hypothetical protein
VKARILLNKRNKVHLYNVVNFYPVILITAPLDDLQPIEKFSLQQAIIAKNCLEKS